MLCTWCSGTGFLNIDNVPKSVVDEFNITGAHNIIIWWIESEDSGMHDVSICDCCGDGENWYGEPGRHYGREDPAGDYGPYGYNNGVCECH